MKVGFIASTIQRSHGGARVGEDLTSEAHTDWTADTSAAPIPMEIFGATPARTSFVYKE